MSIETTIETVRAALKADIADVEARMALADAYEEAGEECQAEAQRAIAALRPCGPLTREDRAAIEQNYIDWEWSDGETLHKARITESFDEELLVWHYDVDREDGCGGDPTTYLECLAIPDASYDRIRRMV